MARIATIWSTGTSQQCLILVSHSDCKVTFSTEQERQRFPIWPESDLWFVQRSKRSRKWLFREKKIEWKVEQIRCASLNSDFLPHCKWLIGGDISKNVILFYIWILSSSTFSRCPPKVIECNHFVRAPSCLAHSSLSWRTQSRRGNWNFQQRIWKIFRGTGRDITYKTHY